MNWGIYQSFALFVYFVFVILFILPGTASLSRQKRVIGGSEISQADRPWLVSLHGKIVTERLFGIIPIRHRHVYCGGSLLNDRWVLTAAHCFDFGREGRDVDAWEVRLATVDLELALADRFMNFLGEILDKDEWRTWELGVSKIIIHPGYNKDDLWYQDIALVQLKERAPRYRRIKPIQLPDSWDYFNRFPVEGTICHMTGWGCTQAGSGISRYAMTVELPIVSQKFCDYHYHPRSMRGRLCAGFKEGQGGICPGDSGGPLVCQTFWGDWVQVGVASFTSKNNPEKFPAVFTLVADYITWIRSFID